MTWIFNTPLNLGLGSLSTCLGCCSYFSLLPTYTIVNQTAYSFWLSATMPCLGNVTGFATGLPGVRVRVQTFVPPKNPYPWHGLAGLIRFQTPLESAGDCQLSTRNCAFPPTATTNHHSRIAKEGEWVVHPPISHKGMLFIG